MSFFFFNDTATTEIYTLSLHDALPILVDQKVLRKHCVVPLRLEGGRLVVATSTPTDFYALEDVAIFSGYPVDRKSTRLNSSHANISYAVFCLKKKKQKIIQ